MSRPPVLEARGVTKTFLSGAGLRVDALRGVDLAIGAGEFAAVVGPSGCGKSTLLHILGLVDPPTGGSVAVDGTPAGGLSDGERTRMRLTRFGFVFQRFYLLPILDALENVELPMMEAGVARDQRRRRAGALLSYVGLAHRARHRPAQLSGGEMQRVAIARALANDPVVILADEPTGELDRGTGSGIIGLFRRLADEGRTLLIATHDPHLAESADVVYAMEDGRIVATRRRGHGA